MSKFKITENTEELLETLSLLQQAENKGSEVFMRLYGEKAAEEWMEKVASARDEIAEALISNIYDSNYKDINTI